MPIGLSLSLVSKLQHIQLPARNFDTAILIDRLRNYLECEDQRI